MKSLEMLSRIWKRRSRKVISSIPEFAISFVLAANPNEEPTNLSFGRHYDPRNVDRIFRYGRIDGQLRSATWKIIKTRETKDISGAMYLLTVTGFALWFAYGLLLGQWPLIVANGICFVLSAFILLLKVLPVQAKHVVSDALDPSVK